MNQPITATQRSAKTLQEMARYHRNILAIKEFTQGLAARLENGEEPNARGVDALFDLLIEDMQDNYECLQQLI